MGAWPGAIVTCLWLDEPDAPKPPAIAVLLNRIHAQSSGGNVSLIKVKIDRKLLPPAGAAVR